MKVILISGKARHGKDLTAKLMTDSLRESGKRVLVTHYADLVKYICREFFNWNGEKDEAGRTLLQYVGTDVVRQKMPDYWVDFIIDILDLFGDNWDYVIIPDTRFPNEIDRIKARYECVHLRVRRENTSEVLTTVQQNHISETALDDVEPDLRIENNGTIEDLKNMIETIIKENLQNEENE